MGSVWDFSIDKLTIMKDANRKNITSINGMISMRGFLKGTGLPHFRLGPPPTVAPAELEGLPAMNQSG
jgi:hypothetical protein